VKTSQKEVNGWRRRRRRRRKRSKREVSADEARGPVVLPLRQGRAISSSWRGLPSSSTPGCNSGDARCTARWAGDAVRLRPCSW